jgi:hypothetical protein
LIEEKVKLGTPLKDMEEDLMKVYRVMNTILFGAMVERNKSEWDYAY